MKNFMDKDYRVSIETIKLCLKLGKMTQKGMLQTAFGPSCMYRAIVFEWHKRFKEGRESARDD